jgi:hypothetical protein
MGCTGSKTKETFDPIDEPAVPERADAEAPAPAPATAEPEAPAPAAEPKAPRPQRAPAREVTNPKHMTSRQLVKALAEKGVTVPEGASRAEMEALYPADDAGAAEPADETAQATADGEDGK